MSANEPYFVWKGVDSRTMSVWVQQYPPIVRPPERYETVTIPGRPGALTMLEGSDVYDPYVREMKIMPKPGANIYQIMRWLTGSGAVVFGHEPNRSQQARIYDEASFQHEFAGQRSAVLRFLCDPFKTDTTAEETITPDVSLLTYDLPCQGDVIARPLIEVTASATCTITVDGVPMSLDIDNNTAYIDCETRTVYAYVPDEEETPAEETTEGTETSNEATTEETTEETTPAEPVSTHIEPVVTHGDFWTLPHTGTVTITWTSEVTALTIRPRWRWF